MTKNIKGTIYKSWKEITRSKANKIVRNLQRRIFVAKQEGRYRTLRKLQTLLLSAQSNRILAVRQVCQLNPVRQTGGIDKKVFITPKRRFELISYISSIPLNKWKPTPIKHIYIQKANGKQRSLGILALVDRVLQVVVKNALEPE